MPEQGFSRVLSDHNTKIVSVCDYCGYTIVASVNQGLQNLERLHVDDCEKRRDPNAKASSV